MEEMETDLNNSFAHSNKSTKNPKVGFMTAAEALKEEADFKISSLL